MRDSLLRASSPTAAKALFYQATAPSTVTLRNVTAVASGPHSVARRHLATDTAPAAAIEATNLIADAEVDLSAHSIPASTSAINAVQLELQLGRGRHVEKALATQVLPPRFVNAAAGDFRQAPDSPTIDSGLTDGGNSAMDLDGNPRTVERAHGHRRARDAAGGGSGGATSRRDTTAAAHGHRRAAGSAARERSGRRSPARRVRRAATGPIRSAPPAAWSSGRRGASASGSFSSAAAAQRRPAGARWSSG